MYFYFFLSTFVNGYFCYLTGYLHPNLEFSKRKYKFHLTIISSTNRDESPTVSMQWRRKLNETQFARRNLHDISTAKLDLWGNPEKKSTCQILIKFLFQKNMILFALYKVNHKCTVKRVWLWVILAIWIRNRHGSILIISFPLFS